MLEHSGLHKTSIPMKYYSKMVRWLKKNQRPIKTFLDGTKFLVETSMIVYNLLY